MEVDKRRDQLMPMDKESADYFVSYEDLNVHRLMLDDRVRVECYREAIFSLQDYIKDKVIMDVGAGTGILSIFCAQAGAKRVYAVEASGVADLAQKVVEKNNFSDIIKVIHSTVEEVQLPYDEKVDAIVAEWMGHFLLHEGMLDSIIIAREKHLKPDGKILPESAVLYACPCTLPSQFDYWNSVYNIDMSDIGMAMRKSQTQPLVEEVKQSQLLGKPHTVLQIDLYTIKCSDLDVVSTRSLSIITTEGLYQGICLWFDCAFPVLHQDTKPIVLSTSPGSTLTHWKQTVLVFHSSSAVEKDQPVAWELILKRSNTRQYSIQLETVDPNEVFHPLPCPCYLTKCIVVRTLLECEKEAVENISGTSECDESLSYES